MSAQKRLLIGTVISIAVVLFICGPVYGAPLENVPVTLQQPDGEVLHLFATGDEFYHWVHDENGFTIVRNTSTGYLEYATKAKGALVPSGYIVGKVDPASVGLKPHLNITPKQIQQIRLSYSEPAPSGPQLHSAPQTGTINNVVVFIRFSGEPEFTDATSIYNDMFNSTGAGDNSMNNYFHEVSYSALTVSSTFYPIPGSTIVSYHDAHPRGYYQPYDAVTNPIGYTGGDNGTMRRDREHILLKNAVDAVSGAIPEGLNVDGDGDGYVDNVCFIVYGEPTGWGALLWPHMWLLYSQTAIINGKQVGTYNFQLQTTLASDGVGVLCHEMFHSLGAPDLYHYSHDGLHPVGPWDIMEHDYDPPQHMGAYMKYRYGTWIGSIPVISAPDTYTLNPLTSSTNNCYKIASNSPSEYFVVEYRRKAGTFESSLPASGLLVYRINTAEDGYGNAYGPPDEVYIYRPGGTLVDDGDIFSAHYSSSVGRTAINDTTSPSSFLSGGGAGGLDIWDVSVVNGTISFKLGHAGGDVGPLVYDSHTIDDDNSGQSSGNDDGVANPGESIETYVTLYNAGTETATGVSVSISEDSPYVAGFLNNTVSVYSDIPGGGTGANLDDFEFAVDGSAPDGHIINFTLTINASNGGPWADTFQVTVHTGGEPDIDVTPTSFDVTLPSGQSTQRTMTINNVGQAILSFSLSDAETAGSSLPEAAAKQTLECAASGGGPDAFGYIYRDSAEPDGPAYQWVDISGTGTAVYLSDDQAKGPFDIGFTFNFYGTDWTQFYVSSNGFLSFGSGSPEFGNECPMPDASTPNGLIALLWDDLDPDLTSDAVYYQTFSSCPHGSGACLVVQYEDYHLWPGGGDIAGTFEAILFESDSILIQFEDAGAEEGLESTTGIENSDGTIGLTYACDTAASLSDELAICFAYPGQSGDCSAYADAPWLSEDPTSGAVAASGSQDITVTFDATGLTAGTYTADIVVASNDPDENPVTVPVTMNVTACYDFNEDGTIDIADVGEVANRWRARCGDPDPGWPAYDPLYDIDDDCDIDVLDIMLVVAHWGETCG